MATLPATLEQQKQQLRMIWTAMLSAVGLYGAVSLVAIGAPGTERNDTTASLHNAFTVAGIILGGLSVWWRRRFLSTAPAPAGADLSIGFAQLQGHGVVVWALSEAVAVCGLMLAFIVRDSQEFVPFGVAGVALLVLHRPSRLPFGRLQPPTR